MAIDYIKAEILNRINPDGQKTLLGQELLKLSEEQKRILKKIDNIEPGQSIQKFFTRTAKLKATEAATRVSLLDENDLASEQKAYPIGFYLILNGENAWDGGNGRNVYITDSGTDLIYRFATINAEQLTPRNYILPNSDGVILEAEFGMSLGGRLEKGIDNLADGNFEVGSDLYITVYGLIA